MVGPAFTLRYIPARQDTDPIEAFREPDHPQRVAIETCPEGHVLVMDCRCDASAASAGSILLTRLQIRGGAGVVSDGGIRDAAGAGALDMPVFAAKPSAPTNLTKHHAVQALRGWANGWCTSKRFHDSQCPGSNSGDGIGCIFGCRGATDSIQHYFQCTCLWDMINERFPHGDSRLVSRLGLAQPYEVNIKRAVVASFVYHNLRVGDLDFIRRVLEGRHTDEMAQRVREVVRAAPIEPNAQVFLIFCSGCGQELYECNCPEWVSLPETVVRAAYADPFG